MQQHTKPTQLRMSAPEIHQLVFSKAKLSDFIYWLGYIASGQCASERKMALALEPYCDASFATIRRWINGEAKPNGSNMLMIYGGVQAYHFNGVQKELLSQFLNFAYPKLSEVVFDKCNRTMEIVQ